MPHEGDELQAGGLLMGQTLSRRQTQAVMSTGGQREVNGISHRLVRSLIKQARTEAIRSQGDRSSQSPKAMLDSLLKVGSAASSNFT